MKKCISLILVLGFLAYFPQKLGAKIFSIKPSMGISYGGSISDRWAMTHNYFGYQPVKNVDNPVSVNGSFELAISIFENFSISAGAGYLSRKINGTKAVFSSPGTTNASGDFFYAPKFNFKSLSASLTAQWTFPVSLIANAYVLGGIGYYFSRFSNYDKEVYYSNRFSDFEVYYFPVNYNAQTNSFGYHLGVGAEIELDLNIFLFFESLYRRINFEDLDTEFGDSGETPYTIYIKDKIGDSAAESMFIYYINTASDKEWGEIYYSIDNILFSEIVLRVGMRIAF